MYTWYRTHFILLPIVVVTDGLGRCHLGRITGTSYSEFSPPPRRYLSNTPCSYIKNHPEANRLQLVSLLEILVMTSPVG